MNLTQQDIDKANALWRVQLAEIDERFNPNHDDKGKFATGDGDDAEIFVSPNEKEDLKFEQAKNNLKTKEHGEQHKAAQDIIEKVDHGGTVHDAVGDWNDGAENSLVVTAHTNDLNQTEYMASLLGDRANQKAVIAFVPGEGKDTVWQFSVKQDVSSVRGVLNDSGVTNRTLEPTASGTHVYVFDPGTELRGTMETIGAHYGDGITINATRGNGEFIGADTRDEAHQAYGKIISQYEKSNVPYSGQYRALQGQGVDHHRDKKAFNLTRADLDQFNADGIKFVVLSDTNRFLR